MATSTTVDETSGFRGFSANTYAAAKTALTEYIDAVKNIEYGATTAEVRQYCRGQSSQTALINTFNSVDTQLAELVNTDLEELKTELENLRTIYGNIDASTSESITTSSSTIRS